MRDNVEEAIWADVQRHENGCWGWPGRKPECNIIRLLADLSGKPLPALRRMYRMPGCALGKQCVNPDHVGTAEEWMLRTQGFTLEDGA
jgi:hypothetical protein